LNRLLILKKFGIFKEVWNIVTNNKYGSDSDWLRAGIAYSGDRLYYQKRIDWSLSTYTYWTVSLQQVNTLITTFYEDKVRIVFNGNVYTYNVQDRYSSDDVLYPEILIWDVTGIYVKKFIVVNGDSFVSSVI